MKVTMNTALPPLVVADVGGTNLRLATLQNNQLVNLATTYCEAGNPETFIHQYLQDNNLAHAIMCIAIAGPVNGDAVSMINFDWHFSQQELKARLGLEHLYVINDFHAMSLCVPHIPETELIQVGGGEADKSRACIICGPGTGLGIGHLIPTEDGDWVVMPGEGGHSDMVINSEREMAIWQLMHRESAHVFTEKLLSGPGLVNIYHAVCKLDNIAAEELTPENITQRAVDNRDTACTETLNTFCELLGSLCGSLALTSGALGGVYITGGLIPKILDYFKQSNFRSRFEDKGSYAFYVEPIPTYVIVSDFPGLTGAASYLNSRLVRLGFDPGTEQIKTRL
jgi:glucokinase